MHLLTPYLTEQRYYRLTLRSDEANLFDKQIYDFINTTPTTFPLITTEAPVIMPNDHFGSVFKFEIVVSNTYKVYERTNYNVL